MTRFALLLLVIASGVGPGHAAWVHYLDETATRLVAAAEVGAGDVAQKDYAWADVDKDGDTDLVVVRKQPWTVYGKRTNVFLMNEAGTLVDRTSEYASASDVIGDAGFLTPTNDRDVALVDVNLDGWPDIVTAVSLAPDSEAKELGYPRVYMNLGEDGGGNWLGFRYEAERIPAMLSVEGLAGLNPRFFAVAAGDVTGDGYPDLYFTDSDTGGGHVPSEDFDDKLLVNQGSSNPGFFSDATDSYFPGSLPGHQAPFTESGLSAAAAIADMNDDGVNEIAKVQTLTVPVYIGIAYDLGLDGYDLIYQQVPTFFSLGDLNNDELPEVIVTDDGVDRFLVNQGGQGGTEASFLAHLFSYSHSGTGQSSGDDGFGGNSVAADLDNDGWNDVLVTDVDSEIPGCSRRMHVYHNRGGEVGGQVTLTEETSGSDCATLMGNPASCIVASFPADVLEGAHDVAVLDIDQDGWLDVVVGRCTGTEVYMNVPPVPAGGIPDGDSVPGTPLIVSKEPNGRIGLDWSASCVLDDTDYEVYEGAIGNFASHQPATCSTGGSTSAVLVPTFGNRYYLVVPANGTAEGSYGTDGDGTERPAALDACLNQVPAGCD